jgi:hypothetical protein
MSSYIAEIICNSTLFQTIAVRAFMHHLKLLDNLAHLIYVQYQSNDKLLSDLYNNQLCATIIRHFLCTISRHLLSMVDK